MGVATDLVRFFQMWNGNEMGDQMLPRTLGDFYRAHPHHNQTDMNPFQLMAICRTLEKDGLLIAAGVGKGGPPMCNAYFAAPVEQAHFEYGTLDFMAFGFQLIRKHFAPSVLPLVVENSAGLSSIGSGFVVHSNRIVTARHCIEDMNHVTIVGCDDVVRLCTIHCSSRTHVDLAVLTFDGDPRPTAPKFVLDRAHVLDDVMTMGYPPVPGFDLVQVAETARLAAKAATGAVVAQEPSYLGRQEYLLISARVKGGNSGGPVINKGGAVVGVVTDSPSGEHMAADPLGYGMATPSELLSELLNGSGDGPASMPFELVEGGFRTCVRRNY